jgi:prepilin-type processing-associated H-X9-DG protein
MSCSNNFKQIGLAIHNYHAGFKQLPMQQGGTWTDGNVPANMNNRYDLSYLVALTPFFEQQSLWEQISNPSTVTVTGGPGSRTPPWPAMGPAPFIDEYSPWLTEVPTLRCPSDPGYGLPGFGRTNYAACMGDSVWMMDQGPVLINNGVVVRPTPDIHAREARAACRGAFVPRQKTRFRDVLDGLSNTVFGGEIATDLGDRDKRTAASIRNETDHIRDEPDLCLHDGQVSSDRPQFWVNGAGGPTLAPSDQGRGFRWACGATVYTEFNTILPPNRELCLGGDSNAGVDAPGVACASSRHQGGTHILMGDGAVIFITDSIEAGSPHDPNVWFGGTDHSTPGSESPYGLWGAMGTRSSRENISEQLNQ